MNSTGQPAIVSVRRLANATPEVEVRQAFARVTSSTCLNSRVYRELLAQGYDTLVLNYEAPNPNPNPNPITLTLTLTLTLSLSLSLSLTLTPTLTLTPGPRQGPFRDERVEDRDHAPLPHNVRPHPRAVRKPASQRRQVRPLRQQDARDGARVRAA